MQNDFLSQTLEPLHLLKHPFYQDWMAGRLTQEQLRDYAGQYFKHVSAFPRYIGAAHSLCPDLEIRKLLLENLNDEEGFPHGTPHPELWLDFAEGLGLKRGEASSASARAGIENVVSTFFRLSRASLPSALGALYAYEAQVPEIAQRKIEGLKARYGVEAPEALAFFELHKTADVFHRETLKAVLEKLPAVEKAEAMSAAKEAATALWDFLSDVHQHGRHAA